MVKCRHIAGGFMRVHLAIIFSLICSLATADDSVKITSTAVNQAQVQIVRPVSIGHPHTCSMNYPIAAVQAHAEGTTTLSFTITTEGTVKGIKVAKSSNNKDLDDAAVQCVANWVYQPATKNGKPTETPWQANVIWKIPENPEIRRAAQCLRYRGDLSPIPPGVGMTSVTFRVMPDGAMKDAAIARSSGNKSLDDVAVRCITAGHFDTSLITLPSDGVPGHADLDWAHVVMPPQPVTSPPSK
jgi:TonB family protein